MDHSGQERKRRPRSQPKATSSRKPHRHPLGPWAILSLCPCLDSGIQGLTAVDENERAEKYGVGMKLEVRELAQRARDRVLTLNELPAGCEAASPFHCSNPHRVFRTKGHTWDWTAMRNSPSVLGLGASKKTETPGDRQGVWGPTSGQDWGWMKWESLRTQKSSGRGPPAYQTWILTLEAGQTGVLRFGFQQVWQPCIAVPEPTALGGGRVGMVNGASNAPLQPVSAMSPHLPSSQAYPPEPHQDPVGLGPGPLLIGSQEAPHHGNASARAMGGRHGVRLAPRRAQCVPPCPRPPLTAPQGSAPRPAGSLGSTHSWPGPASVSHGCLPGQATPQQVPGMTPDTHASCPPGWHSAQKTASQRCHPIPVPLSPLEGASPVPTMRVSAKCLARMAARRVRVSS